ncbi:MAG: hypothetical protein JNL79_35920 [Myxococcales bacterium]|nr:hypothetical protein [Myxococcales bacterium]
MTPRHASVALALALALAACRDRGDPQARAVLTAYRAFEEAQGDDRKPALAALSAVPCAGAVCAARDACVRYGSALVQARNLVDKAKTLGPVDAGGNGAATPSALAVIVGAADDATKEAAAAEPACEKAITELAALGGHGGAKR